MSLFCITLIFVFQDAIPYNDYFEYFGPYYTLHFPTSNMINKNTPSKIDKIKVSPFPSPSLPFLFPYPCGGVMIWSHLNNTIQFSNGVCVCL